MRQRERAWKRETAVNRIRDIDTDYSEREGRAFTGTKIPREREREKEKKRGEREKDRHIQTDRQTETQRECIYFYCSPVTGESNCFFH